MPTGVVRFDAGTFASRRWLAPCFLRMSENKSRERGEKRALADTEDAKKAAADDDVED